MRIKMKWFRQAYLEERPGHVLTEFMLDDGRKFQTFQLPSVRERNLTVQEIIDAIDFETNCPVICGESK